MAVIVTFELNPPQRAVLAEALPNVEIVSLAGLDPAARTAALRRATVVLARNIDVELQEPERALLGGVKLLQFITAGVDYIRLSDLPAGLAIACNGGAYAEPMAEHAVAMAFAAAKRLLVEHAALARGEFNQFTPNRLLLGGVCGVLGFGGIGLATARRMRALGLAVHAINRSGHAADVDWIGTPDRLDALLAASDVLVVSLPLTRKTERMLGARELGLMKPDAILVNLARGEIIDEAALYAHLKAHPRFTACIDAWWIEPVRHGRFAMDHPFLALPNVIASPHNSASVSGQRDMALRAAAANCARVFRGESPQHRIGLDERMR